LNFLERVEEGLGERIDSKKLKLSDDQQDSSMMQSTLDGEDDTLSQSKTSINNSKSDITI